MDIELTPEAGGIVTFYSYKGGVGRSMALANTGFLLGQQLARRGQKALVIDWDLEAPGLHRYFPIADGDEYKNRPGIIDYFWKLSETLNESLYKKIVAREQGPETSGLLSLKDYVIPDVAEGVDLIRAGCFDSPNYPERVASFDWVKFYRDSRLIFRALREVISAQYPWCLIDSRTGLSDASGISTMLMPEKLVAMFTLNRQSLEGVLELVRRATDYRRKSDDPRPLSVFPLPSRIAFEELELLRTARQNYRTGFEKCLRNAYGVESCDLSNYFDAVEIPQQSFYSFHESIPARDDPETTVVTSINKAYERFFERMVTLAFAWESLEDARRAEQGDPVLIPAVRALPPGSRMPHAPNPLFVGRDDELRQLASHLALGSSFGIHRLGIAGLGGVGKTQLAIEYAHRYGVQYPTGVFWLNLSGTGDPTLEIARCGGAEGMNLPNFDQLTVYDQAERVVKAWEQADSPSLIVLDDVHDPDLVQRWMPKTGTASMLITSRRADWAPQQVEKVIQLDTLAREESLKLLAQARPLIWTNPADRSTADAICERLGDLPLALNVAISYLRKYKAETLKDYLAGLQEGLTIQDSSFRPLLASFTLSYKRLDENAATDKLAKHIFHLAAYFGRGSISRFILAAAAGFNYEKRSDRHQMEDAFVRLQELGLISDDGDRLRLHGLLREFARARTPEETVRTKILLPIANALLRFSQYENSTGLPQRLLNERMHLREVASSTLEFAPELAADLLSELGVHGTRMALFEEARADLELALKIDETLLGSNHPMVARDCDNLGALLLDLADYSGARAHFERALKINEAISGPEDSRVAQSLNNMGLMLREMGDFAGARASFERALKIEEGVLGTSHPDVARSLNNLGRVLRELGDIQGARASFERGLKIDEATYGSSHPYVARDLNNLGILLAQIGDNMQALACLERALAIDQAVFGLEHPSVASRMSNLGTVLGREGKVAEARRYYEQALTIFQKVLGPEHPQTREVEGRLRELTVRQ